jgi:hypothetical protein
MGSIFVIPVWNYQRKAHKVNAKEAKQVILFPGEVQTGQVQNYLSTRGITYSNYLSINLRESYADCSDPEDELPALRPHMDTASGGNPHMPEVQKSLLGSAKETSGGASPVAA